MGEYCGVSVHSAEFSLSFKKSSLGLFFNTQKGRVLREYQFVYITKGRGVFSSENTPEKPLCRGRLIVLFPGQWHTYHPYRQTGWNEYYIGFEGPVIDNLMKNGFLSKDNQVLEVGLNEELVSLFPGLWRLRRPIKYLPSNILPVSFCI